MESVEESLFCSDSSAKSREPLAGTAAETARWIALEVRDPWTPKGFPEIDVPAPVLARLRALQADGARIQLIRRPRRQDGPLRLLVIDGLRARAWGYQLDQYTDLLDIPLDALWTGDGDPGAQLTAPAYLVCTHGRRDRCCARKGIAVYLALEASADGEVWQTTHLGGHRFAPTLLAIPHGVCYGRIPAEEMLSLSIAHDSGHGHHPRFWRGRCAWPRPAQAAEIFLRSRQPRLSLDAVQLSAHTRVEADHWRVVLHVGDSARAFSVRSVPVPEPVLKSCRDTERKVVNGLIVEPSDAP